ncbi:hypothetical protein EYF80_026782 [Liparis tanakae]|uniref:Ig-like domain-containing protein n=1 Tax=Liparis tanakae TaxID=230148 RepID=A0A4Z2HD73_9TELE|nr:hypothetical protein EYF80_026782 [Liparis tanakae]
MVYLISELPPLKTVMIRFHRGPSGEGILEMTHNVTAVLGEDVYLSCSYLGESEIRSAEWKRQINSKMTSERRDGFFNGEPFSRDNVSKPESLTNLTVKVTVSRVEAEGEYISRPDIQMLVNAEIINFSHCQSVSCSAVGGRPLPQDEDSVTCVVQRPTLPTLPDPNTHN